MDFLFVLSSARQFVEGDDRVAFRHRPAVDRPVVHLVMPGHQDQVLVRVRLDGSESVGDLFGVTIGWLVGYSSRDRFHGFVPYWGSKVAS